MSVAVYDRTINPVDHPKMVELYGTSVNTDVKRTRELTDDEKNSWEKVKHTGDTLPDTIQGGRIY